VPGKSRFIGVFAFAGAVVPRTLSGFDSVKHGFVGHKEVTHHGGDSLAGAFNIKLDMEITSGSFLKSQCASMILGIVKMSLQEIEQGWHVPSFVAVAIMNCAKGSTEHHDITSC